jgi:hypothetical protein
MLLEAVSIQNEAEKPYLATDYSCCCTFRYYEQALACASIPGGLDLLERE